jgi:hypothetical protein
MVSKKAEFTVIFIPKQTRCIPFSINICLEETYATELFYFFPGNDKNILWDFVRAHREILVWFQFQINLDTRQLGMDPIKKGGVFLNSSRKSSFLMSIM